MHIRLPPNGLAVRGHAHMRACLKNVFSSLRLPVAALPLSPLLYNPATMEIWKKKKKKSERPSPLSSGWKRAQKKKRTGARQSLSQTRPRGDGCHIGDAAVARAAAMEGGRQGSERSHASW